MKKKKWNRVLAVLLMMVMSISLLSGCGGKSTEKEDAETITVYLWSTNLYEKYAPYIQEQLPDINVEFVVGNNDLDFYKFLDENGGLPDIITCCRFSLHDASPLKDKNHCIWKLDPHGVASLAAGRSNENADGKIWGYVDGNPLHEARFNQPAGLAYDPDTDMFYIGDIDNKGIRYMTTE